MSAARRIALAAETAGWQLDGGRLGWLIVALALVLAPHAARIPLWSLAGFVLLAGWRVVLLRRRAPTPSRWLLAGVGLLLAAGVIVSERTLFGRGPGITLLALLAGMKLVEARERRDAYVIGGLAYFLVVTNFLYSQSIPTGLYMVVVVTVITAALIALNVGARVARHPLQRLRLAGSMLLQAVPVMLVLFVLFPRVSGPLWGLPKDAHASRSGLSGSMTLGDINRLSLSDEVAFRVRFDRAPPPPAERYWRGPVLWRTDGRHWRARRAGSSPRPIPFERQGSPIDYVVTLEPNGQRWLFALDLPGTIPRGAVMTRDFQIVSPRRVHTRTRYRVRSWPHYRTTALTEPERAAALALPPGAHPRARALAERWRGEADRPAAVIARALAYLREEPFHYTLTPPLIDGDVIDGFLFDTRRGFCEYFAGAYTVLMRAAGIPARVVTGYQGGEVNEVGDFLTVRQRDAHAWVEVWLEGRGWVRVDPTAAVAPNRIEQGLDAAIPPTIGPSALSLRPSEPLLRAWRNVRQVWDALDNGWNQWVLGYGPERQRRLLDWFGIDAGDYKELAVALATTVLALLAALTLWMRRVPPRGDPAVRLYRRFCRRLARAGIERADWEGPRDFARRAAARRPDLAAFIDEVTSAYIALRYGRDGDLRRLRRALARGSGAWRAARAGA